MFSSNVPVPSIVSYARISEALQHCRARNGPYPCKNAFVFNFFLGDTSGISVSAATSLT